MKAKIHSIESFATLDGGGIRFALFLQGCPLRCLYCHNPDTWDCNGTEYFPQELINKIVRYKNYYLKGGGVTVSGGEPLLQSEFLYEFLTLCKIEGFHTAIDTSGAYIPQNIEQILALTDLAIVDLKHYTEKGYNNICNGSIENTLKFLNLTMHYGTEVLLRTVIVPNLNDKISDIENYAKIAKQYSNIKNYQLLGYHTMGVYKYQSLGIEYPLENVPPMDNKNLEFLQKKLDELMQN